jgi:two-component system, cell cycle sensor histidine kinase and response regulator CckA
MIKIKQLAIGYQVMLIFGLICAILVAIGMFLFFSLRAIEHRNKVLEGQILNELTLNDDIAGNLRLEQNEVAQYMEEQDSAEGERHESIISNLEQANASKWNDYGKLVDNETEAQLYARALEDRKKYLETTATLLALRRANKQTETRDFALGVQAPAYEKYQSVIDEIVNWTAKESGQMAIASTALIGQTERVGDTLVGIAMLVSIGAGFTVRRIARRLKEDKIVLQTEVAERKRAEETLRLLGSAMEQSKESIVITDGELDLPGPKIIFVNPAFTKMTGYTAEEAIGKTPRMLQGPRTDKTVLSRLRKNLERGEVFEGETINYRKDGKEFDLEWQIAPIRNASGEITHFVAIQRDITERKQTESRMFQSQKMETVGKLAGGVAHEFNSILTAIIGQSELLIDDLPPDGPLGDSAREIRQAAERAAVLTRQLLAYGRKQILQPAILDLNIVLTGMLNTLQHLMGREVDVRIVPANGLKAVKIDPGQMEQVIVNIAMNAADAMPNGGKFTLETANTTLDEDFVRPFPGLKAGNYVVLSTTDTGMGMSEEIKSRVFEPFFSTKGAGQGTGLGLATCYGILKQSDGHINVYSENARGSTFKIYLPQVEPQTHIPTPRLKSIDLPRGTETILLAEDDSSLLKMASTLLRRLGYTVLTAANGIEALGLKNQRDIGHIDLLLTDVVMPHMSGKELSDRIQAIYPHTKILFTSAYTENAIAHQGILNKGVMLLHKPFTPSALAKKVREVLDQQAQE